MLEEYGDIMIYKHIYYFSGIDKSRYTPTIGQDGRAGLYYAKFKDIGSLQLVVL